MTNNKIYRSISRKTSRCVLIAEIAKHNLALKKSSQQSSTYKRTYPSSRAVDGNKKGGYCAQTSGTDVPWWQVELTAVNVIQEVEVTGGCSGTFSLLTTDTTGKHICKRVHPTRTFAFTPNTSATSSKTPPTQSI